MVCENIFTAPPRPNGCRWCFQSQNRLCLNFLDSKSRRASKLHYWFKSYGNFDELVDFAHWWSFIGKGLLLQPAQQACFFEHRSLDLTLSDLRKSIPRHTHGATLGCIFFGFWSPKSDKKWKVLRHCLTNLPWEVPQVIKLSLGAGPLGKVWLPSGPPKGKFFKTTPSDCLLFLPFQHFITSAFQLFSISSFQHFITSAFREFQHFFIWVI